jgi:D-alanyl-D-alanine dipeptidase
MKPDPNHQTLVQSPRHLSLVESNPDHAKVALGNGLGEMHPLSDAKHIIFNNTVSDRTILRMAKSGGFPAFKLNGGKWYFILEVAQEWLVQRHQEHGWLMQKGA